MKKKPLSERFIDWMLEPGPSLFQHLPLIFGVVGFLATLFFYFPGVWHYDASVQHAQAVSGLYGDWHPPVMAASLRGVNRIFNAIVHSDYSKTGVLFTLYALFFWTGMASVLAASQPFWRRLEGKPRLLSLLPFGLILTICSSDLIPWTAEFSKDIGMLGSYLLAVGMLLNWPNAKSRQLGFGLAIPVLFLYGTSLRHNAIFSLLPLVVWFVWLLFKKRSILKIGMIGLALWGGILGAIHVVNYGVLQSVRLYPMQERFYADIFLLNHLTGVYVAPPNSFGNDFSQIDKELFDRYYREGSYVVYAMGKINEQIPEKFRLLHNILLLPGANPHPGVVETVEYEGLGKLSDSPILLTKVYQDDLQRSGKEDYSKLRSAWIQRIKEHPVAYVKLRLKTFYYFCVGSGFRFCGINSWILSILLCLTLTHPLCHPRRLIADTAFPRVMLGISALLYLSPYLFFLTAEVNRYTYWFLFASTV